MQGEDLKARAFEARTLYNSGNMSREEAQKIIQPYLDAINTKAKELAKKYDQKPKKVSFGYFIR